MDTKIEDLAMLRASIRDLREALTGLSNLQNLPTNSVNRRKQLEEALDELDNARAKLNYVLNNPNREHYS